MTDVAALARNWVPAVTEIRGTIAVQQAVELGAFLGTAAPADGDELPPFWHEVFLREPIERAGLGPDGHPRASGHVPPMESRQRLFGGGRLEIVEPLRVGARARRTISVDDVRHRSGSSGELLLVTELHEWTVDDRPRLRERRDIVYREADSARATAAPVASAGAAGASDATVLHPDEVMLFGYSALTRNAHRIHYDRRYAQQVEGHRDLLVHGPLTVTLGLELLRGRHPGIRPASVTYRLTAPAYVGNALAFAVREQESTTIVEAWSAGRACMRLEVDAT